MNNKSGFSGGLDRVLSNIENGGNAVFDKQQAIALIVENILCSLGNVSNSILVTGSVKPELIHEICEGLKGSSEDFKEYIIEGKNLLTDPKTLKDLRRADSVVFVESREQTSYKQFVKAWDSVKKQEKEILGYIDVCL